jgi:phospholipid-binding lipoprotein MlaA
MQQSVIARLFRAGLLLAAAATMGACASNAERSNPESDPWEPMNRGIYKFNNTLDRAITRPIAIGYRAIMPTFASRGVTNFSKNLRTPSSALNNFLQGKPRRGLTDIARFLFNSTFGIGGLIDVASDSGLEVYEEDFGQTLAVWGVPDGPFVVIPLLGPFTLRDGVALPVNVYTDLLIHYDNSSVRDRLYALRFIDLRARLLTVDKLLEDSKDPYITIRESYLQNRIYQIYDGDPPEDDDFYDDFEEED